MEHEAANWGVQGTGSPAGAGDDQDFLLQLQHSYERFGVDGLLLEYTGGGFAQQCQWNTAVVGTGILAQPPALGSVSMDDDAGGVDVLQQPLPYTAAAETGGSTGVSTGIFPHPALDPMYDDGVALLQQPALQYYRAAAGNGTRDNSARPKRSLPAPVGVPAQEGIAPSAAAAGTEAAPRWFASPPPAAGTANGILRRQRVEFGRLNSDQLCLLFLRGFRRALHEEKRRLQHLDGHAASPVTSSLTNGCGPTRQ
ncbi:hypothetical protein BS78_08G117800 [Paspalum vaginatum]|nr:hypothetical protein BS78_08G117800 [Paspalum vaginatum]